MPYKPGDKVMIISDSEDNPHLFPIGSVHTVVCICDETEYNIEVADSHICISETECIQVREDCDAA